LTGKLVHDFLNKFDYWKADTIKNCKANSKKCVLLENGDWYKIIEEKYYQTFKKGCKFLISNNNWVVFVRDKEGLLIGIISSLFVTIDNIEM
jgi:hypothetical protein